MTEPIDFERPRDGEPPDETDISVRAYFSRLDGERLREYDPNWTDEQIQQWDGNFRSDGVLMLVCCERDVDTNEYRRVLEEHLKLRGIVT